ncbi:N-acetylmuramoyl-L-alanine amidase [Geodermatophilus obscurus]|uniref:Cell wall hydrolase/autolysin n=1 Tax=Geodermatophilus obscurus (strain ATCC 25078 / DSM 43160 / JCM 3152 / CCUG 61914 / KCC A-0152 / KCTC 9177 / NBRC 13315 / NRRL B-3577 / G-20) TaxID=526225 RepID=D2SAI8_GEOOG|nr:N-acetylmuramoyl-L-alanine amidase [Geodermatophilus obscurus]ADB73917.1 cell wall hydrolase/autolysin [Geodermatophilus obscurus DSM 43160]
MVTERPGHCRGCAPRGHRRSATALSAVRGAAFAVALSVIGSATACTIPTSASSASTGTTTQTTSQVSSPPFAAPLSAGLPAVVVLDPGHNGGNAAAPADISRPVPAGGFTKPCNTVGAQTSAGYPEHAFAFDVAHRAADLLRAKGVTVALTRTDDSGVGPCVNERADAANEAGAALAVSIHADGADPDVRGFHVIKPALAPDGGNAGILEPSEQAAFHMLTAFSAATAEPMATYPGELVQPGLTRRNDLAGLNLARVPAIFIECGNMRNHEDGTVVTDPDWRQRAAQGIANGVLMFLASRP